MDTIWKQFIYKRTSFQFCQIIFIKKGVFDYGFLFVNIGSKSDHIYQTFVVISLYIYTCISEHRA